MGTDPATGQPIQQIIQNQIDPKTGKITQIVSSIPTTGAGNANIQIITVTDPKTGKPTQQAVQTRIDPKTGKSVQVPVQMPQQNGVGGGPAPQMAMVPDPVTGKLTQQLVQTVTDPKTGKTMQIPVSSMPGGGANQQIISVTDPATGKQVQQIVQTIIDPQTGKPTQVTMPLTQNGNLLIKSISSKSQRLFKYYFYYSRQAYLYQNYYLKNKTSKAQANENRCKNLLQPYNLYTDISGTLKIEHKSSYKKRLKITPMNIYQQL